MKEYNEELDELATLYNDNIIISSAYSMELRFPHEYVYETSSDKHTVYVYENAPDTKTFCISIYIHLKREFYKQGISMDEVKQIIANYPFARTDKQHSEDLNKWLTN